MNGIISNSNCIVTPSLGMDVCAAFEKQPRGLIFTAADFKVPAGTADIGAYLRLYALPYQLAVNGTESGVRLLNGVDVPPVVFPLLEGLTNLEPTGGDVRISQEGFGSGVVNGHENYQEMYTFLKGGLCMYKQLAKMEGRDYRVFFVDEDNKAYGVRQDDGTTRGFMANVGVNYRKNVGTTPAAIMVTLLYSTDYTRDFKNLTSFEIPEDLESPRELVFEVDPVYSGVSPASVSLALRVKLTCSGVDVTKDIFGVLSTTFFEGLFALKMEFDGGIFIVTPTVVVAEEYGYINLAYVTVDLTSQNAVFTPTQDAGNESAEGIEWLLQRNLRLASPPATFEIVMP